MTESLIQNIVIAKLRAESAHQRQQAAASGTSLPPRDAPSPAKVPSKHPGSATDSPSRLLAIADRAGNSREPAESTSSTTLRPDEATLSKRQEMAAKGLLKIIRKKNVERRRAALGEMTSSSGRKESEQCGGDPEAAENGIESPDGRYHGVKSVEQSMINGYIISAIPEMSKSVAIACLVLNIVFPGLGNLKSFLKMFFCNPTVTKW